MVTLAKFLEGEKEGSEKQDLFLRLLLKYDDALERDPLAGYVKKSNFKLRRERE